MSRALEVRIVILYKDYKTLTYNLLNRNHIFAPIGYQKTVYIVKTGLHYNTLLPKEYENPLMRREQERSKGWSILKNQSTSAE